MTQCSECGTDVPRGGKFCPECGTQVGGGHNERSDRHQPRNQTTDWQSQEDEEWDYPVDPTSEPRLEDHKLLLGSVLTLSVIGFLEGVVQLLYAEMLVELAEQEFGIEGGFATEQLIVAGVFGIIVSLVVVGATVYFYREGYLRKAYFWVLVGSGVAGFLLAQSLFLTILVGFGIYGLVSVMD